MGFYSGKVEFSGEFMADLVPRERAHQQRILRQLSNYSIDGMTLNQLRIYSDTLISEHHGLTVSPETLGQLFELLKKLGSRC